MASNSRYEAWLKQHKSYKLFMESALTVKSWGRKDLDKKNKDRTKCNPYGFPKDLKAALHVAKKR